MNNNEKLNIDVVLVKRLIADQFPEWQHLLVQAVANGGWENRTFRLGDDKLVRMPSAAEYAVQVEKEQHWLPKLASFLPLSIPIPLAMGQSSKNYPWQWSIYRWLEGEPAAFIAVDYFLIMSGDTPSHC